MGQVVVEHDVVDEFGECPTALAEAFEDGTCAGAEDLVGVVHDAVDLVLDIFEVEAVPPCWREFGPGRHGGGAVCVFELVCLYAGG